MFEQQPLKMASAEAACDSGTELSLLTIGNPASNSCDDVRTLIAIPGLLSFLAHGDFDTPVMGVNRAGADLSGEFGTNLPDDPRLGERAGQEIDYVPLMWVTYWGFRSMIGFGAISTFGALLAWWLTRKRAPCLRPRWLMWLAVAAILLPFAANVAGWVFTEMGRQPFVVAPNPTGSRRRLHVHGHRGIAGRGRRGNSLLADRPHWNLRHPGDGRNRLDREIHPRRCARSHARAARTANRPTRNKRKPTMCSPSRISAPPTIRRAAPALGAPILDTSIGSPSRSNRGVQ